VTQRGRKIKITTLCDPLCSLWFNLPYHNRILRKSEKVHALANYQRAYFSCQKTEDRNQETDQQIWAVTKNPKRKKDSRNISGNLYFTYAERLYQHMRIGGTACNRLLALKIVYCDLSRRKHRTIDLEEIEASRLERVIEWLSIVSGRL